MTALLVALGAAVGAPLRYASPPRGSTRAVPRGTLLVNVVGLVPARAVRRAGGRRDWLALLGTGFCGGFTTYSAFAVQTHRLGPRRGAAYAVVTVGGLARAPARSASSSAQA